MSRLWPTGEAIGVMADDSGVPQRLIWQGRPHAVHNVARRWRVDTDWWRGRVYREYFKLTTRSGLLVLIYHDLIADTWFVQRLYD